MVWKFTADLPVYQQIIAQIQGAVLAGELSPGDRLPSVRDLAAAARVNPNTMQHALQELERQELVSRCVRDFANYGIAPEQAAQLLRAYQEGREEP